MFKVYTHVKSTTNDCLIFAHINMFLSIKGKVAAKVWTLQKRAVEDRMALSTGSTGRIYIYWSVTRVQGFGLRIRSYESADLPLEYSRCQ